ncbi:Pycsar system effector family protein [Fulvivirga imtechensis]|uniref:Pycsar system effector family protein n=1 Tax=Fulvivirga imtechensis TaxID=881893 RepID=UPI00058F0ABC
MEKERLQFCINRFDHYYDSINNKCAVFLGLGTFILGGLIASYPYLLQNVECTSWIHVSMGLLILLSLVNLLTIISASTPHLSNKGTSMFYFASISSMTKKSFDEQSTCYMPEVELDDLRDQVRELSTGLTRKFQKLKIVGRLFSLQFILFIPLIIFVIINFKIQ